MILRHRLVVENDATQGPTFEGEIEGSGGTYIDLTLSSPALSRFVHDWRVLSDHPLGSDHHALMYSVQLTMTMEVERRLNWRKVDWELFRPSLRESLEAHLPHTMPLACAQDVEAYAQALGTALEGPIASLVPRRHRPGPHAHAWWSPRLDELRQEVTRARRHWVHTQDPSDKRDANACKRALRRAIAVAKRASWRQFCTDTSPTDFWRDFERMTCPPKWRRVPDLVVGDQRICDEAGKAHALTERFFPDQLRPDDAFHVEVATGVESTLAAARLGDAPPVTEWELHEAIFASGAFKAPGSDGIPNVCLRQCEDIFRPYLLRLFLASLQHRHVLSVWKLAEVVAVPKPSGEPSSPAGYRPISLLLCISKALERIDTARLTYFLEHHHLLSPVQFGFRQRRSAETALWRLASQAGVALQSRRRMVLLSLDIKGAYDRVWHPGLLHKLASMGIPRELLGWVRSFLADRVATVGVGTARETRRLLAGVPQGSPLSCILFLVFVNDLLTDLDSVEEASAQAFADDVTAWWIVGKDEDSDGIGQRVSAVVSRWARCWKAEFSPSKCLIMGIDHFRPLEPDPTFILDGTPLTCVPCLRCLGVWIDSRLTWHTHITRVSDQALAHLRGIYRGVGTLWGFHPLVVRRFVEASILPLLFYAAPAWCTGVRGPGRAALDRVLRQCAITTMGLYRTVSGDAARFLAGLLQADTFVRQQVVDFYVRHLSYGVDLEAEGPPCPVLPPSFTLSSFTTCDDYLRACLRPFAGRSPPDGLSLSILQRAEVRCSWATDPSAPRWDPLPSILADRIESVDRICTACREASWDDLWIFTDGSVCGLACGAAAVLFDGTTSDGQTSAVSFHGFHSSTQAELVALRLGCAMADQRAVLVRVTFVCDSQSALKGVQRHLHYLELALAARDDLARLHDRGADVRLWWTPSHVDLRENDLADVAARRVAQGDLETGDGESTLR